MANNESTAINALLHNLTTRRVEEPSAQDNLFVTRPPQPFVQAARTDPSTLPVAIAPVPSLAPGRAARGTAAPPHRDSAEQTELWTAPPMRSQDVRAKAIEFVKEPIATPRKKIVYAGPEAAPRTAVEPSASRPAPAAMPAAAPVIPPASVSRTGYHIAKEILLSTTGLGLVAIVALGFGVYLAIKTHDRPEAVKPPTERDRAVAIMTNTPVPELPTHVSAPTVTPIAAEPAAMVVTPITAEQGTPEVTTPAPPSGGFDSPTEPAAEPAPANANDTEVSESDIEIEANTPAPKKKSRRVKKPRVALADKPAKIEKQEKPAKVDTTDPVLAAIHDKQKPAKPSGPATEIAAVKGAAPSKGTGSVSITSNVKAVIYVDGRPTGKSSPSSLIIPAGDHQITLLDPDTKKAKTATVVVEANKALSVRKDFN